MASPENVYREFVKRTHRTMAAYLAIYAWTRDLDCIAIERNDIMRFWDIAQHVVKQRLAWFEEDVKQYFPHVKPLWFAGGTKKFKSLFLARRPFPQKAFNKVLPDEDRAAMLTIQGFNTAVVTIPSEHDMLAQLTAVIHGLSKLRFVDGDGEGKTLFD